MIRSARPRHLVTLCGLLLVTGVAGCAQSSPRSRASAAALQKCRVEVDRVYSAQNRVDLSTRDTRDTPFASNYLSGITSRGLGAEYGRDNMTQACLNDSAEPPTKATGSGVPSTGPTFGTTPGGANARPGGAP